MLKRIALTLALLSLPAAAMAQEHQHHGDAAKKHEHAAAAGQHISFPQLLIQKSAELKLTEEQVAKLEAFSAKMAAHHKADGQAAAKPHAHAGEAEKPAAKHDHAEMEKMHAELLAIFTTEQVEQIKPLMKAHMEGMCADGNCKMEKKKIKAE